MDVARWYVLTWRNRWHVSMEKRNGIYVFCINCISDALALILMSEYYFISLRQVQSCSYKALIQNAVHIYSEIPEMLECATVSFMQTVNSSVKLVWTGVHVDAFFVTKQVHFNFEE